MELQRSLGLKSSAINMTVLQDKLQEATLRSNFQSLKSRIVANMDQSKQIPDYKIELYIRNYIIDPLLEDNYQILMGALKTNLRNKFIPLFPH